MLNVVWMEREFDAYKLSRSMYPSIFNSFPVIRNTSAKSRRFHVPSNMPRSCWCLEALNLKSCILSHPLNWYNKLLKSECNLCYDMPLCQYR